MRARSRALNGQSPTASGHEQPAGSPADPGLRTTPDARRLLGGGNARPKDSTRRKIWGERREAVLGYLAPRGRGRALLRKIVTRGGGDAARLLGAASTLLPPHRFGGLCGIADATPLSAVQLLLNYTQGLFPMDYGGKLRWHCPEPRFVLYLGELRLSPNMRRDLRKAAYSYTFDQAPREVLDACGERPEGTWLSERLKGTLLELHEMGVMHSVEAWNDGTLVGGSYGLGIGQVWMGETMFHRAPNAGKGQFAHLAAHLAAQGFLCVDGQAPSEHFARFGAREVSLDEYRAVMARGLLKPAQFGPATG